MPLRSLAIALLCLCGCAAPSTSCPAAEDAGTSPAHFSFAQVTDIHVGDLDGEQRLQQVVTELGALSLPIACVVVTGDLAETEASQDTAKSLLAGLRVPVHVLPGNHDIYDEASARSFVTRWGALSTTAEYQGVFFAFVYDQPVAGLGYDPFDWMEQAFVQAGDKPMVVFHHQPPVDDFYGNAIHPGWPEDKRARWTELLARHRVLADVTGHYHRDEQHFLGTVPLFVSAPVSGRFGRQGSFRIYELDGERISYRSVYQQ